ncbi:MAG: hypothetical protein KF774_08860 [Planctomyces sp.]|nr:hypothetical protein [Planctomyces sp.]
MTPISRYLSRGAVLAALVAGFAGAGRPAFAQALFESEPIQYDAAPVEDRVARLQDRLERGEARLEHASDRGWLDSVLRELDVPASSQALVFSKTSLQLRKISRTRPRALYFNDDTYVGYCQQGDVLELAAIDPQQGLIFYTLDQQPAETPRFVRDKGHCLSCHATARTQGVPGALVRSVFADRDGTPLLGAATFTTDDCSPFSERWGGWYVTGTHGDMRHMGNVTSPDRKAPEEIDREQGANRSDLSPLFDVGHYPTPHSDIVALLVLEHQTQMQNAFTAANYEARHAAWYDGIMNDALDRPDDFQSETTGRRIASASEKIVRGLLFSGEFALTAPIQGTSAFAEEFAARGNRDARGRSLRDFDLDRRLFKYPCSFLIESKQFSALPQSVRDQVDRRLEEILNGRDESGRFAHLSEDDRAALREMIPALRADRPATEAAQSAD